MSDQEQPKKVSWLNQVYQRARWLRVKYGQRVLPQNQQSSNLDLSDDQVMRRREEPVTHSFAFPLGTGAVRTSEESYPKR